MRDRLLGVRVIAETDDGSVHGVTRVRYDDGHVNSGMYEIEQANGTSFLASGSTLQPGPNLPSNMKWDTLPEDVRFCGAEFFRPAFLDGTGRQFLAASPGVLVPSDMEALRVFVSRIEPGFEVSWWGHDCNTFRGVATVESVDDKGVRMRAPEGCPPYCAWPTAGVEVGPQYGYEFQVQGDALHFMHVPPKRYGETPRPALSLTFKRPRVVRF
jgi:hypothetical protein